MVVSPARAESLARGELTSGPPGAQRVSQQTNTCQGVEIKPPSVETVGVVSG